MAFSVYGGAGGRGAKASVSSPEVLRNLLRGNKNNTVTDSAPETPSAAPLLSAEAPPAPTGPVDNKQDLRGLNDRLSKYVNRVKQLEEENQDLQNKIDDILAKRKEPQRRDWDDIMKPLNELEEKIKDLTKANADQLLQNNIENLINEDYLNKLDDETNARKMLEKELDNLKNITEDIERQKDQVKLEIDKVSDDIKDLIKEHDKTVDDLLDKIRNSEVKVEIDSKNSNLAEQISKIRDQYEEVARRNLEETEKWYLSKLDNIKVEEAQNTEACESGKSELNELLKMKNTLESKIQSEHHTLKSLQDTISRINMEFNQRVIPLNRLIIKLEAELREVIAQVKQQNDKNNQLLTVKMKLEKEIESYQKLILSISDEFESSLLPEKDQTKSKPESVVVDEGNKAAPR